MYFEDEWMEEAEPVMRTASAYGRRKLDVVTKLPGVSTGITKFLVNKFKIDESEISNI